MFGRLLVPVDGTTRDQAAITTACRLAKQFGASIFLVHVEPLSTLNRDLAVSTLAMEKLADEVQAQGVECEFTLHLDETIDGIISTARYEGSDLIVLTPHTRSWFERLQHPSVTEALMARATTPLLIWPESMKSPALDDVLTSPDSAIIVPLDGSDLAERAIPFATDLARSFNRPLKLVRVITPTLRPIYGVASGALAETMRVDDEVEARAYMRRIRETTGGMVKVPVHSMILSGLATEAMTEVAAGHPTSVIVMTTHGRGIVGRTVFGSVATALTRHASIPLFIVRGAPAATAQGSLATAATTHRQ